MDKQALLEMLQSIRKDHMLGPKTCAYDIGDYIDFAVKHGLIIRTFKGNFAITDKGLDLLDQKLSWEEF